MSPDEIRRQLAAWGEIWGTPGLAREVEVRPSRRMYRALGNYSPQRDEIRIAAHLLDTGGREMFLEVLGHEAAHAAVRRIYDGRVRPHGQEWKALMRRAGLPPRATLPVNPAIAAFVTDRRARRHRLQTLQDTRVRSPIRTGDPTSLPIDQLRRWMEQGIRQVRRELDRRDVNRGRRKR